MESVATDRKSICLIRVKECGMGRAGRETAAIGVKFSVQTKWGILRGRYFNHATEFPAVFGWKIRGHYAHGLHISGLERRRKCRRAILRQGQTIHDELDIILGA